MRPVSSQTALLVYDGRHGFMGVWRGGVGDWVGLCTAAPPGELTLESTGRGRLDFPDLVVAARRTLIDLGYDEQSFVLALPSRWFLAASIPTTGLPRRERNRAMVFRLEERLPLAAEGLSAVFAPEIDGRRLGVAIEDQRLMPLLEALEAEGVDVHGVCPLALLAAQGLLSDEQQHDAVAVKNQENGLDVMTFTGGVPSSWSLLPDHATALTVHLAATANDGAPSTSCAVVGTIGAPASIDADPGSCTTSVSIVQTGLDARDCALRAANAVTSGDGLLWIDFLPKRGAWSVPRRLVPPLTASALMLVALLVALNVVLIARGMQYRHSAHANQRESERLFVELLPGQDLPVDISSRLESERRALAGSAGSTDGHEIAPLALSVLQRSLAALPSEPRHRILSVAIDPQAVHIEGQARSHSDAEALAAHLRDSAGLTIDPPLTRRVDDRTVSFILNAATTPPTLPTPPAHPSRRVSADVTASAGDANEGGGIR